MAANNVVLIISTFTGLIAMGILLLRFRGNSYQKFLFLLFIFSFTYVSFLVYLVNSQANLTLLAHLYRTGSPFQYLTSISFFLLSRAIGRKQVRPTGKDLLWFLIPLLNILELLPYYLSDVNQKLAYLEGLRNDQDIGVINSNFLLPVNIHFALQAGLGILLFGATFLNTYKYRRVQRRTVRNKKLLWLNTMSLFLFLCYGVLLLLLLTDSPQSSFHVFASMIFSFTLILVFLSIVLDLSLFNKPLLSSLEKTGDVKLGTNPGQITEEERNFQKSLEDYFRSESEYLKTSFRIQDLADSMKISRNSLSYLINTVYKKNFNELVNEKRIEVVLENMENLKWKKLSIQGIAEEVGFKSRTTFNTAFKRKTGYTFTEYRDK